MSLRIRQVLVAGGRFPLFLVFFLSILPAAGVLTAEPVAEGVSIEPVPDWAEPRENFQVGESSPYAEGGVFYHRLEDHFRPDEDAVFSRVVYEFQSRAGLEDFSTLVWNVDPEFESLQLHWIGVYRDGEWIDLLPDLDVEVVDARTDVRSWFYDDSKDVRIILEGVEVGDVLDYGFTREGSNPVVGDRFSGSASLGYTVPVGSARVRLDWPVGRENLQFRTYPGKMDPEIREENGYRIHEWELDDLQPIVLDYDTPADFEVLPWVQFTDWPDWRAVALWAADLYPVNADLPPLLEREAERIRKKGETPAEQATEALQFIQDTIRYVSIPVGPHSYQPYPPEKSAERKYGDCKDKSLLLVLLLRELGFEAELALVSTSDGRMLKARLPSETVFDHVLVRAEVAGTVVWMDPTESHQGGVIPERYFADYGYALVVSEETEGLHHDVGPMAMEAASIETVETFHIRDFSEPVDLIVESTYTGRAADNIRWDLAADGLDSFARAYMNYYATVYDLIPESKPLELEDDRKNNELVIRERYEMPELFAPTDDDGKSVRNFPAEIIRDQIPVPSEKIRSGPFALYRPLRQVQVIKIHLPDDSTFEKESFRLDNDWFFYDFSVVQEGRLLRISHAFVLLADFVPADRVDEYLAEVDRVEEYLDYVIEVDHNVGKSDLGGGFLGALQTAFTRPPAESPVSSSGETDDGGNADTALDAVSSKDGLSLPIVIGISLGSFFLGVLYSAVFLRRKGRR